MKTLIFIVSMAFIACSSSKNNNLQSGNATEQQVNKGSEQDLPACLRKMISQFMAEEKQNPPREVYSYTYKGKTVYYVTPPCCDFFSDLYDSTCTLIGHPDGGFSGRGDGTIDDFKETRSNEKLVWKDDRK